MAAATRSLALRANLGEREGGPSEATCVAGEEEEEEEREHPHPMQEWLRLCVKLVQSVLQRLRHEH